MGRLFGVTWRFKGELRKGKQKPKPETVIKIYISHIYIYIYIGINNNCPHIVLVLPGD